MSGWTAQMDANVDQLIFSSACWLTSSHSNSLKTFGRMILRPSSWSQSPQLIATSWWVWTRPVCGRSPQRYLLWRHRPQRWSDLAVPLLRHPQQHLPRRLQLLPVVMPSRTSQAFSWPWPFYVPHWFGKSRGSDLCMVNGTGTAPN